MERRFPDRKRFQQNGLRFRPLTAVDENVPSVLKTWLAGLLAPEPPPSSATKLTVTFELFQPL